MKTLFDFLDFVGPVDVFRYADGSVLFRTLTPGYPEFGGKNWQSAVESGLRKFKKEGLYKE